MFKVVALGGGHGLAATLASLRQKTQEITAIVTVADNGGSSGRLREEFPIFPPGDLRMALTALCADDEWGRTWAEILQHRFNSDGDLNGHAMGNLLLASMWNAGDDPVVALDRVGQLLKVIGRVLPMAAVALDIEGTFNTSTGRIVVRGQKEVATAKGHIQSLRLFLKTHLQGLRLYLLSQMLSGSPWDLGLGFQASFHIYWYLRN